jgi:hypothetical protein
MVAPITLPIKQAAVAAIIPRKSPQTLPKINPQPTVKIVGGIKMTEPSNFKKKKVSTKNGFI